MTKQFDEFQIERENRELIQLGKDVRPKTSGRLVDIQIDGIDTNDYPDFVDAYISYAYDEGLERELNEDELEKLNEDSEFVYQCVLNHLY